MQANAPIDLQKLETQLKKRWAYPYQWGGRKQNNTFDKATRFVYNIRHFGKLQQSLQTHLAHYNNADALQAYALNRWYNFWSAKGVEQLFNTHPLVTPHPNPYHRSIDFYINKLAFDHKSSIYPKQYPKRIATAIRQPKDLAIWLYRQQSRQQRFHVGNRLFIVFYHPNPNLHWQLKAEINCLSSLINTYLQNISNRKLIEIPLALLDANSNSTAHTNTPIYCDIIWAVWNTTTNNFNNIQT